MLVTNENTSANNIPHDDGLLLLDAVKSSLCNSNSAADEEKDEITIETPNVNSTTDDIIALLHQSFKRACAKRKESDASTFTAPSVDSENKDIQNNINLKNTLQNEVKLPPLKKRKIKKSIIQTIVAKASAIKSKSEILGKDNKDNASVSWRRWFPCKLHQILATREYSPIISWSPDGKSWKVNDEETFMKNISPNYFKQKNFQSFLRVVYMWGFKCQNGSFQNKNFLRGNVDLCKEMVLSKSSYKKKSTPESNCKFPNNSTIPSKDSFIGATLPSDVSSSPGVRILLQGISKSHAINSAFNFSRVSSTPKNMYTLSPFLSPPKLARKLNSVIIKPNNKNVHNSGSFQAPKCARPNDFRLNEQHQFQRSTASALNMKTSDSFCTKTLIQNMNNQIQCQSFYHVEKLLHLLSQK